MADPFLVVLLGFLIVSGVSFFLTLSETSFVLLPREQIKQWKAEKFPGISLLENLTDNRKKLLGFLDFLQIVAVSLYFSFLTQLIFISFPVPNPQRLSSFRPFFLLFSAGIFFYALFCRFLPRRLGQNLAEKVAGRVGILLAFPFRWLGWIEPLLDGFSHTLSSLFFKGSPPEKTSLSEGELKMLVTLGKEEQLEVEEEEKELIESVVTFGQTIVKEVMVPRIDMVCLDSQTPISEIFKTIASHGYTKYPVYEGTPDNIVGVAHVQDLIRVTQREEGQGLLKEIIRKPYFVPESKKVDDLLREMQKEKISMAIVVDEYGGTDGLVTIEDLVEEIVGEIGDEHSTDIPDILPLGENRYLVDGKINMEDLNSHLELDLPTEEFETLSGYVYSLLGRVPKAGEKLETNSVSLEIAAVQRQRISRIILTKKMPAPETLTESSS